MCSTLASVEFTNMSNDGFTRDNFGLSSPADVWDAITPGVDIAKLLQAFSQSPATTMPADDVETMTVSATSLTFFTVEDLWKDSFDIFCVWIDQITHQRFGVGIHIPVQILGIGTRPSWYVMSDSQPAGTAPDWQPAFSDPSQPYTWPAMTGLTITAVPDSQHTTLSLNVNISANP